MPDNPAALLLRAELGGPDEVIDQLTSEQAQTVLALFVTARLTRQRRLDSAIDAGLQALPRLVRIPARKILFGK